MKRILAILLLAVTVFFAGCQKNAPAGSPALTEPDI
jgi:hypothetical protein